MQTLSQEHGQQVESRVAKLLNEAVSDYVSSVYAEAVRQYVGEREMLQEFLGQIVSLLRLFEPLPLSDGVVFWRDPWRFGLEARDAERKGPNAQHSQISLESFDLETRHASQSRKVERVMAEVGDDVQDACWFTNFVRDACAKCHPRVFNATCAQTSIPVLASIVPVIYFDQEHRFAEFH